MAAFVVDGIGIALASLLVLSNGFMFVFLLRVGYKRDRALSVDVSVILNSFDDNHEGRPRKRSGKRVQGRHFEIGVAGGTPDTLKNLNAVSLAAEDAKKVTHIECKTGEGDIIVFQKSTEEAPDRTAGRDLAEHEETNQKHLTAMRSIRRHSAEETHQELPPRPSGGIKIAHSFLSDKMLSIQQGTMMLCTVMDIASILLSVLRSEMRRPRENGGGEPTVHSYPFAYLLTVAAFAVLAQEVVLKVLLGASWLVVLPAIIKNSVNSMCQRNGIVFRKAGDKPKEWREVLWVTSKFDKRRGLWCDHGGLGIQYAHAVLSIEEAYAAGDACLVQLAVATGVYSFVIVAAVAMIITLGSAYFPGAGAVLSAAAAITTAVTASMALICTHLTMLCYHVGKGRRIMREVNGGMSFATGKSIREFQLGPGWGSPEAVRAALLYVLCPMMLMNKVFKPKPGMHLSFLSKWGGHGGQAAAQFMRADIVTRADSSDLMRDARPVRDQCLSVRMGTHVETLSSCTTRRVSYNTEGDVELGVATPMVHEPISDLNRF